MYPADLIEHIDRVGVIQVADRLVAEQDPGMSCYRAGDGNPLALTPRERTGKSVGPVLKSDGFDRIRNVAGSVERGPSLMDQANLDVVEDGPVLEQVIALEYEAEGIGPGPRSVSIRPATRIGALEPDDSVGGGVKQPDEVEEGGLPAATRPGEGYKLPDINLQVDVGEGNDIVAVDLRDTLKAQRGSHRLAHDNHLAAG